MRLEESREQMIEQQVRAWSVLDEQVLETMREVPRERFVPEGHRYMAFMDADIPLPCGQHMLRPNVVGRLLQALAPRKPDRVLEIGAGSGYVTACLAALTTQVHALEIFPELTELARSNLASLGLRNAQVATADALDTELASRYDVIALTASLPVYVERFERQLEIGGRMFAIVGEPPVMEALLVRRVAVDRWAKESLFETVVDPLIHARRPDPFVF